MASRKELQNITVNELQQFLAQSLDLCSETLDSFLKNRIDGESFLGLSKAELKELIAPLGDRKKVQKLLSSHSPTKTVSICCNPYFIYSYIGLATVYCGLSPLSPMCVGSLNSAVINSQKSIMG